MSELQERYCVIRREEETYVLRDCLSYEERIQIVERLEAEAKGKLVHAEHFYQETMSLIEAGKLDPRSPQAELFPAAEPESAQQ